MNRLHFVNRSGSANLARYRIAFVHDWLTGMRGGERVLEELLQMFPNSQVFTLFYRNNSVSELIRSRPVRASVLSHLPGVHRFYRYLLPIYSYGLSDLSRQLADEHEKEPFDLIISVSHCVAKNITPPPGVPHICYCLTPMRYIWDQYDAYFKGRAIEPFVRYFISRLRQDDLNALGSIDEILVISEFVRARVESVWRRDSQVIFPPVRTNWITPRRADEPGDGFLCVSALVPYKKVDVVVVAFNQLNLPLTIVGSGPEEARLRSLAGPNIRFLSGLSDSELALEYRRARALVFAAEEDFGMAPVEAQAAGRPVIAFGKGGSRETVSSEGARKTGLLVCQQNSSQFVEAVYRFLDQEREFTVENCQTQARRFSVERFREDFYRVVDRVVTGNEDQGAGVGASFRMRGIEC